MRNYSLVLVLFMGIYACTGKTEESSQAVQQEVHNHDEDHHHDHDHGDERVTELMAIHDSIMPKMQDLHNLKKELTQRIEKADNTLAKGTTSETKAKMKEAESIRLQLEQADEAMMDWMHHYNADTLDKLDTEKATLYIAKKKREIEQVRDLMESSKQRAEKFLQKDKQ